MKEDFKEFLMDSQLNIRTTGRNDKHSDTHRYPYEPTSYTVLERVVESGFLIQEDVLLDYGCGMGRVPIFLHNQIGCRGIGIELVKEFYKNACANAKTNGCEEDVLFVNGRAEKYEVPPNVTACFFFNPFDLGIMRGVMNKILDSFDKNPRRIRLFFYYPQDEYIAFLSTVDELEFVDEIDCMDLFAKDERRNRVIIFDCVGWYDSDEE